MNDFILDASALLALVYKEPGHEMVAHAMSKAIMSSINLSIVEFFKKLGPGYQSRINAVLPAFIKSQSTPPQKQ